MKSFLKGKRAHGRHLKGGQMTTIFLTVELNAPLREECCDQQKAAFNPGFDEQILEIPRPEPPPSPRKQWK